MNFWKDFEETFFPEIKGNLSVKLALVLNLIDPNCSGALILGESGTGKSKLLINFYKMAKALSLPCEYLPLGVSEENLLGGLDLERTLEKGEIINFEGILSKVKGGYLLVDDLYLLSESLLSIIFSKIHTFTLIATHNPLEGEINPHYLEKIGLIAFTEAFGNRELRKDLLKEKFNLNDEKEPSQRALRKIILARNLLKRVKIPESMWEKAVNLALKEGALSHRSEIILLLSARAFTALKNEESIKEEYLSFLAPLVFTHRKKLKEEKPTETQKGEIESKGEKKEESQRREIKPEESPKDEKVRNFNFSMDTKGKVSEEKGEEERENLQKPSSSKEEVFPIIMPQGVSEFLLKGKKVGSHGKRLLGKSQSLSFRKIGIKFQGERREIDLYETLKASLPYQKVRGFNGKIIIKKEDLRFSKREGKGRTLLLLVVDGSGSMGVHQRMKYVKGVIFHFLKSSYRRRDRVALIVFRKFGAELLVPPSNSLEFAYKVLKGLPVGGNTPLSAGLELAKKTIKIYKSSHPQDHILLLLFTDGKANIPIKPKGDPWKEIKILSEEIAKIKGITGIVIDTEKERELIRFELAKDLAKMLRAHYFKMEKLSETTLVKILRIAN